MPSTLRYIIAALGVIEALLLARLVLRLLAARPDNPAVAGLLALTGSLTLPLRPLDAGQPRFGAVLEFSTLAVVLLVGGVVLLLLLWPAFRRKT